MESFEQDETYWPEADYDDTAYYHNDLDEEDEWDAGDDFDQEAGYYGGDDPLPDPAAEAQVFDEAYAPTWTPERGSATSSWPEVFSQWSHWLMHHRTSLQDSR